MIGFFVLVKFKLNSHWNFQRKQQTCSWGKMDKRCWAWWCRSWKSRWPLSSSEWSTSCWSTRPCRPLSSLNVSPTTTCRLRQITSLTESSLILVYRVLCFHAIHLWNTGQNVFKTTSTTCRTCQHVTYGSDKSKS